MAASSSGRALGGGGAGGVAEDAVRAHRAHAAGPQRRQQLGQRRRCRRPLRDGRTRAGSSASCTEVSVRPACASPSPARRPGPHVPALGPQQPHRRGDRARRCRRARTAAASAGPSPAARTGPARPAAARSRPRPIDSVPGKPACSPLDPYGTAGATSTPSTLAASRDASATATSVSVDSGRCGPCCSVEPDRHDEQPAAVDLGPRSATPRSAVGTEAADEVGRDRRGPCGRGP